MEKEKIVANAEIVKSFAIGFIGICFTSIGATYFEEQAVYRVPRILLPVFDILGNVGLAVCMIVLGIGFIFYGFTKWKKYSQKKMLYPIIVVPTLILVIFLAFFADIFKDRDNKKELTGEEMRDKQIDEIRKMEKPDFKNKKVEEFLSEFDIILKKYEENVRAKNEQGIQDSEEAYSEWMGRSGQIFEGLDNDDKVKLSAYMAQLAFKWHDTRNL